MASLLDNNLLVLIPVVASIITAVGVVSAALFSMRNRTATDREIAHQARDSKERDAFYAEFRQELDFNRRRVDVLEAEVKALREDYYREKDKNARLVVDLTAKTVECENLKYELERTRERVTELTDRLTLYTISQVSTTTTVDTTIIHEPSHEPPATTTEATAEATTAEDDPPHAPPTPTITKE